MSVGERPDPLDSQSVEPRGDTVKKEEEYKFPEEHKEPFRGLNFLGHLTREFEYLGHKIVIKTLTTDETLAVAQVVDKYKDTIGQPRAYATAMVAACIVTVDDQPLVSPLGEDSRTPYADIWQRYNYIKARWYPPTIDAIYSEYLILEQKVYEVLESMGKASG